MKKAFFVLVCLFAVIGFCLTAGFFAVKWGFTNVKGIADPQRTAFVQEVTKNTAPPPLTSSTTPKWVQTPEWRVLSQAVSKDSASIQSAAKALDIKPRLLVSLLIVEQLRLFFDNRELFKTVFAPLGILGNQNQFSWGVMGIKEETAESAERYLLDTTSPFYPGAKYEHLLDFSTDNRDEERFERLTDEHDRYYSYLYAAVIVKEIMSQWQKTGFPLDNRPDIISTLYNIGFSHSLPNTHPASGGAPITVAGKTYSFGSLSQSFYDSDELQSVFPK